MKSLLVLAALLAVVGAVVHVPHTRTLTLSISASEQRCFYAYVSSAEDRVMFSYQVRAGHTDFDVEVKRPDGGTVFYSAASEHDAENRVFFVAQKPGEYSFCLDNTGHSRSEKIIAIQVAVESHKHNLKRSDPLVKSLRHVSANLQGLVAEQVSLRTREREHRDTIESNNTRVITRFIIELTAMLAMSVGQVWYLRRLFNKRTSGARSAA